MARFTLVHLSDLHLGVAAKPDQSIVIRALLDDLKDPFVRDLAPDLVMFSGDLVNKGMDGQAFQLARDQFIEPILEAVNLPKDRLCLSPGNHDLQLDKTDPIWEDGLTARLKGRDQVNDFLDIASTKDMTTGRFAHFTNFRNTLRSDALGKPHSLWASYRVDLGGIRLGIACVNSAWRATGRPDHYDYGKLLLGERQLDSSLGELGTCDIKIMMMHHPFSWLQEFDQKDVQRLALAEFDVQLFGHNHHPSPEVIDAAAGGSLVSHAGCLYQSRHYFNGYSIIHYDLGAQTAVIHLRQYFDSRRQFDKAIQFVPDGKKEFALRRRKRVLTASEPLLSALKTLSLIIDTHSNRELLSAITGSTAPRVIKQIFVEPPLAKMPEYELNAGAHTRPPNHELLRLPDLLASDENVLFVGKNESGKTTLLNRSMTYIGDGGLAGTLRMPFYVPLGDLKLSNKAILKAILDFSEGQWDRVTVEGWLADGKCVVMFDDVPCEDGAKLRLMREFTEKYSKNRFLFTTDEDLLKKLNLPKGEMNYGVKYQKVYVHQFSRSKTKELVGKWFSGSAVDVDQLCDSTLRSMQMINVPRSPFLISLFLWIRESQKNFRPINHAALVERFIHSLLEKLNEREGRRDILDYRNKEHYLSHLAKYMVTKGEYLLERLDLERETLAYFESKGFSASIVQFVDYFLDRGVFVEAGGKIGFKYRCFSEYFIAKQMMEDSEFYEMILSLPHYLDFAREFDFLTGLQRNNRKLMEVVRERLEAVGRECAGEFDAGLFESVSVTGSPLEKKTREELVGRLQAAALDDGQRDEMLDAVDTGGGGNDQEVVRSRRRERAQVLYDTVNLFSRLVRNCELIDDVKFKDTSLQSAIRYWSFMILALVLVLDDVAEEKIIASVQGQDGEETPSPDEIREMLYWMKIVLPIGFQQLACEALGSEKLAPIIAAGSAGEGQGALGEMMYAFLQADLRYGNYLDRIDRLVSRLEGHRYPLEVIFHRLLAYYMLRRTGSVERQKMEELIGNIFTKIERSGSKVFDDRKRDRFLTELKRKFLTYSPHAQGDK